MDSDIALFESLHEELNLQQSETAREEEYIDLLEAKNTSETTQQKHEAAKRVIGLSASQPVATDFSSLLSDNSNHKSVVHQHKRPRLDSNSQSQTGSACASQASAKVRHGYNPNIIQSYEDCIDFSIPESAFVDTASVVSSSQQLSYDAEDVRSAHDTIQKIIHARLSAESRSNYAVDCLGSLSRMASSGVKGVSNHSSSAIRKEVPPSGVSRFIGVTDCSDDAAGRLNRFYLPIQKESALNHGGTYHTTSFDVQLLSKPYSELVEEAAKMRSERSMREAEEAVRDAEVVLSDINRVPQNSDSEQVEQSFNLWVDKYKPRSYTDLLSDEGVNRTLLTWLNLWQTCVFRKQQRKPRQKVVKAAVSDNQGADNGKGKPFKRKFPEKKDAEVFKKKVVPVFDELSTELDKFQRPKYKVALLAGPPGLGKTTLAHVIARHAGYNVVELNASDDRSVEKFRSVIEACTQTRMTVGKVAKPNCLIIDEVDGAPAASVNYLVSVASNLDKKSKKKFILKRPIICICNDLYAPCLRELRKIALVLTFPPTDTVRLVGRLGKICAKENFHSERSALNFISNRTNNDIRSCINLLQMVALRDGSRFSADMVTKLNIGEKDTHIGMFDLWKAVFSAAPPSIAPEDARSRIRHILQSAARCDDDDKVRIGIFHHYLRSCTKAKLESVEHALDWFTSCDTLQSFVWSNQRFDILPYLSYVPVVFHLLFSASTPLRLEYPSALYDAEKTLKHNRSTLECLRHSSETSCSASVVSSLTNADLVLDVLPFLVDIVQPRMRGVSIQLFNTREKAELARIIHAMIDYNLTFEQRVVQQDQTNPAVTAGQYAYTFDPPISDLAYFDGVRQSTARPVLAYATKQLLRREIQMERVRRTEPKSDQKESKSKQPKPAAKPAVSTQDLLKKCLPAVPLPLPKSKDVQSLSVARDFFGRPIIVDRAEQNKKEGATSSKSQQSSAPIVDLSVSGVWFNHRAGCSNAIRRNVKMSDLV